MKISKEDLIKKWTPILDSIGVTGSKSSFISDYNINSNKKVEEVCNNPEEFNLLPVAIKVTAKSIANNLINVQPISGVTIEELERIEAEVKKENRERKIDSITNGCDYTEMKVEQHPNFKKGPICDLFYLDFHYEFDDKKYKKTRRSGKKHKKG